MTFASEWYFNTEHELARKTCIDYEWRLQHLLRWFKDHAVSSITIQEVDRYRAAKVAGRERVKAARAAGETTDRPLSNDSINKTLILLGAILESAVEYDHLPSNPARGSRRKLKADSPRRTHLDRADQIAALLDAAAVLDRAALRRHGQRRALLVRRGQRASRWPRPGACLDRQSPPDVRPDRRTQQGRA